MDRMELLVTILLLTSVSCLFFPGRWFLIVLTLGIIISAVFDISALGMADNKKTSIFNQARIPPNPHTHTHTHTHTHPLHPTPSLTDLQPVKIQLNNSVRSAFPFPFGTHTHIQYGQTHTHKHTHDVFTAIWCMDCDCCLWGMCFPADSWLVSPSTFWFGLHLFCCPCFLLLISFSCTQAHKSHFPISLILQSCNQRVHLIDFNLGKHFASAFSSQQQHSHHKSWPLDRMLRFVTHWFVVFSAPHTQNVFINYTCSRADALLYGTVLGHVCFLFNFTPDRARPEHKCCSLPLPLSIIPTQTLLQRPPFHPRSGVTSYTANLIHPWPTVTAPNCSDNHMPVIWSGNRRGCWEN